MKLDEKKNPGDFDSSRFLKILQLYQEVKKVLCSIEKKLRKLSPSFYIMRLGCLVSVPNDFFT